MALDTRLLDLLVCPSDKGELLYLGDCLYNPRLRLKYRIDDGIPVMLVAEAETLDDAAHTALIARAEAEDARHTGPH